MQFALILFAMLLISAVAFKPTRMIRAPVARSMTMKGDSFKVQNLIPAAVIPFIAPLTSMAAEGVGRPFGIDDPSLVWAALIPSVIIFPLYSKWSSQQESEDFFDGYEKRRNG
eukprot:gene389-420_t